MRGNKGVGNAGNKTMEVIKCWNHLLRNLWVLRREAGDFFVLY